MAASQTIAKPRIKSAGVLYGLGSAAFILGALVMGGEAYGAGAALMTLGAGMISLGLFQSLLHRIELRLIDIERKLAPDAAEATKQKPDPAESHDGVWPPVLP